MKYDFKIAIVGMAMILFFGCSNFTQVPEPSFMYEPEIGNTLTVYHFDATPSLEGIDSTESMLFRWDFEGDLKWDTDFSSVPIVAHQFTHGGIQKIRLEIRDQHGHQSFVEREIKVIQVNTGSFVDNRDGKEYTWVEIGSDTWMAQNLNYQTEEGSWFYWRREYGRLYTWEAAMQACPPGWILPSDWQWRSLERFCRMQTYNRKKGFDESGEVGYKLKALSGWSNDCNGTDQYAFNVLPAGYRNPNGKYARPRYMSYFWTSTLDSTELAFNRGFHFASKGISRDLENTDLGFSVRCIKAESIPSTLPYSQ